MPTRPIQRRPGIAYLLLGATLVTALQLAGGAAPPVYDGLPVPADRYRYVDPPAGVRNGGPPLSAHVTIQVVGGGISPIDLPTAERPPQAEVSLHHGDVEGNRPDVAAVTTAEVRIRPVPAPADELPEGRQLHGNVYAISVVADGVSLQMRPESHATVSLREPKASDADPRIAVLRDGRWQLLDTHRGVGAGVLTAALPALGRVAILEGTTGFTSSASRHGWRDALVVAVVGALLVLALVVVIRRRRTARRD